MVDQSTDQYSHPVNQRNSQYTNPPNPNLQSSGFPTPSGELNQPHISSK